MKDAQAMQNVRQTPPENAISALNVFVLFSALSDALRPLMMPIMRAKTMISPAEQIVNEMLDTRLRARDSN